MRIFVKGRKHPSGREVEVEYNNSSKVVIKRFPITFDMPGLVLEGVKLYKPNIGDLILPYQNVVAVTTAWDGSSPTLHYGTTESLEAYDDAFSAYDLTITSEANGLFAPGLAQQAQSGQSGLLAVTTDPIMLMVDDSGGGDPGSSQGEGFVVLVIVPAV